MRYPYKTASQLMQEAPRDYKGFESKFDARIHDSKEYRQYVNRMPYSVWDGTIPVKADIQIEPMKCIHLSTENLERLIKEQDRMDSLRDEANYAKTVLTSMRRDQQVRDSNPAVDKAYRNYQMLLELARK
jgi:hypothetical protein